MIRWPFLPRRIEWLIGLSQLTCVATLGVVLLHVWRRYDTLLDGAFIVSLGVFALAAIGTATQTRGVHRALFATFGALAAVACLAHNRAELTPGSALYTAMHAAATTEKAIMVATLNALLPLYATTALVAQQETASTLERSVIQERALSAALEHRVSERTAELEEAQRVLQRMWTLGQQISLELDPTRVLERFIDAASDIAHADGVAVGLLASDGIIRVAHARGNIAALVGSQLPAAGSSMGRVIRTGTPWTVKVVAEHLDEINLPAYERVASLVGGVAVFPISRRGEHFGAVMLAKRTPHVFTQETMARVGAMADLLTVALENAELVETLRQAEWRFRTLFAPRLMRYSPCSRAGAFAKPTTPRAISWEWIPCAWWGVHSANSPWMKTAYVWTTRSRTPSPATPRAWKSPSPTPPPVRPMWCRSPPASSPKPIRPAYSWSRAM